MKTVILALALLVLLSGCSPRPDYALSKKEKVGNTHLVIVYSFGGLPERLENRFISRVYTDSFNSHERHDYKNRPQVLP